MNVVYTLKAVEWLEWKQLEPENMVKLLSRLRQVKLVTRVFYILVKIR
jgi:hypothetical protein